MAEGDCNKVNNNSKGLFEGGLGEEDVATPALNPEEARQIGEATVDEVLTLAQKADELKEHDAPEDEVSEAAKLKEEHDKELEENDGWIKILGNEELMKKTLKKGEPHQRPIRGDICTIRVEGRLCTDESVVFEKEEGLIMQLGDTEVIQGLDLSIPLMTQGETALVKVGQRFAYGSKGLPPLVPPSTDLMYEIELLHSEPEKELSELTVAERNVIGNRKRERGNFWIKRGEASLAVNCYRRGLEYLDEVEGGIQYPDGKPREEVTPELRQLFEDRLKTLNNLAMAQMKLQSYEPALTSVEAVLKCQPNNVKALYRKGKILGLKGETDKAISVLQKARLLEPNDAEIGIEIAKLNQRRQTEVSKEKQLYKRMFGDSPAKTSKPNDKTSDEASTKSKGLLTSLTVGLAISGIAVAVAGALAYRGFRSS